MDLVLQKIIIEEPLSEILSHLYSMARFSSMRISSILNESQAIKNLDKKCTYFWDQISIKFDLDFGQ